MGWNTSGRHGLVTLVRIEHSGWQRATGLILHFPFRIPFGLSSSPRPPFYHASETIQSFLGKVPDFKLKEKALF